MAVHLGGQTFEHEWIEPATSWEIVGNRFYAKDKIQSFRQAIGFWRLLLTIMNLSVLNNQRLLQ